MFTPAFIELFKKFGLVGGVAITLVMFVLYQNNSQQREIAQLHLEIQMQMQTKIDSLGREVSGLQVQVNDCRAKYDSLTVKINKNTIANIQALLDRAIKNKKINPNE